MSYKVDGVRIETPIFGAYMLVYITGRTRKNFRDKVNALAAQDAQITADRTSTRIRYTHLDALLEIVAKEYPSWKIDILDRRPKELVEGSPIRWSLQEGAFNTKIMVGYLNRTKVFVVRPRHGKGYTLSTTLPGWEADDSVPVSMADSQDEAIRAADPVLTVFLDNIGAEFKEK